MKYTDRLEFKLDRFFTATVGFLAAIKVQFLLAYVSAF